MQRLSTSSLLLTAAVTTLSGVYAHAAVTIYGGPGYDGTQSGAGGYQSTSSTPSPQNNIYNVIGTGVTSGAALANGYILYNKPTSGTGPAVDSRNGVSYVFNTTPTGYVRLASAATNPLPGSTLAPSGGVPGGVVSSAINGNFVAGTASVAFDATNGGSLTTTAAVWDANTGAITQLPSISSYTVSAANATTAVPAGSYSQTNQATTINSTGNAAGVAILYATGPNGEAAPNNNYQTQQGLRPVRWDRNPVDGTYSVTQLAISGTSSSSTTANGVTYTVNSTSGTSNAINLSGQVVGNLITYSSAHSYIGTRATSWAPGAAGANAVTLLTSLSTASSNFNDQASVLNDAGIIGGTSQDASYNTYAVRWLNSAATPDKLVGVGTSSSGYNGGSSVYGINTVGDLVGQANFYDTSHNLIGTGGSGAIWKIGTTTATQLSLNASGTTYAQGIAFAVNDSDISVGRLSTSGSSSTYTAAIWGADGSAQTLISLLSPSDLATTTTAGWTRLIQAGGITNNGYVSGYGTYDPDGTSGSLAAYQRAFMIAVPEPTSAMALVAFGVFGLRRRRNSAIS